MCAAKTIVEEVSGWLRVYDDGSVDRTWTGSTEVKFVTDPVAAHADFIDGVATRDVTADPDSGLRVRVYLPDSAKHYTADPSSKLPILLHFHGGGFCISSPNWYMYYHVYATLAKSIPAVIVSVYLRLAPEHRLPAACDDAYAALLWLRSVAEDRATEPWLGEFGDFNRVFLIGDSSGGNIVHEVAARAGQVADLRLVRLAGGIQIHPGFMRSERSTSEHSARESPFLTLDMVDKFMRLSLPEGSTKEHPITCPMGAAAPLIEGLNLPPFLLCLAEEDLIWDTEMEYYIAMKKGGKEVELLVNRGMGHSFYLNKIAVDLDPATAAEMRLLVATIGDFVRRH